jgi:hypothetical protein
MDELGPRARALLDAAEGVDDPAPADSTRVRAALLSRIGSVGFGAALFAFGVEQAKALLGGAVPKLATVTLLAVGTSALYRHWQSRADAPPNTTPAAAVTAPTLRASPLIAPTTPAPEASPKLAAEPVQLPPKSRLLAKAPQRDDLEAEMHLVRGADAALRSGDVALGVTLLARHAREFPNGTLAEEREGLRVVATCQGGATDTARSAAGRFLQRAPHALMAGRIRAACAGLDEAEN